MCHVAAIQGGLLVVWFGIERSSL